MTAAVPHLDPTRALRAADARSGKTPAAGCLHGGQPCVGAGLPSAEKPFGCLGCQTVHAWLTENGLGQSYELEATPGRTASGAQKRERWSYLDDPSVQEKLLDFSDGKVAKLTLPLPPPLGPAGNPRELRVIVTVAMCAQGASVTPPPRGHPYRVSKGTSSWSSDTLHSRFVLCMGPA